MSENSSQNNLQYNDQFLEELEKENKMLEQELEEIMKQTEQQKVVQYSKSNYNNQKKIPQLDIETIEKDQIQQQQQQTKNQENLFQKNIQENNSQDQKQQQQQCITPRQNKSDNSNNVSALFSQAKSQVNLEEIIEQHTEEQEQASYSYSQSPGPKTERERKHILEIQNNQNMYNIPNNKDNVYTFPSSSRSTVIGLNSPTTGKNNQNIQIQQDIMFEDSFNLTPIVKSNSQKKSQSKRRNFISPQNPSQKQNLKDKINNTTTPKNLKNMFQNVINSNNKQNSLQKNKLQLKDSDSNTKLKQDFSQPQTTTSKDQQFDNKENQKNLYNFYSENQQDQCNDLEQFKNINKKNILQEKNMFYATQNYQDSNNVENKYKEKIQSLEMRLAGTQKAVKNLENQLKVKNDKIDNLQNEIDKRIQKDLNTSTHQVKSLNSSQLNNSFSTANFRKKEKDLEKKINDQDLLIQENKKYIKRLQEINNQFVSKIKDIEVENANFQSKNNSLNSQIKNLQKQLNEKEKLLQNLNTDIHDNEQNKIQQQIKNNEQLLQLKRKLTYMETCLEEKDQEYQNLQKYNQQLLTQVQIFVKSSVQYKQSHDRVQLTVNDLIMEDNQIQNEKSRFNESQNCYNQNQNQQVNNNYNDNNSDNNNSFSQQQYFSQNESQGMNGNTLLLNDLKSVPQKQDNFIQQQSQHQNFVSQQLEHSFNSQIQQQYSQLHNNVNNDQNSYLQD